MRVLVQNFIGETRAVALGTDDVPLELFIWRDRKIDPASRCGDRLNAILRHIDKGQGLAFLELQTGEEAVFNLATGRTPPEVGARMVVQVRAEAQGDKLAIVKPVEAEVLLPSGITAFDDWIGNLGIATSSVETISLSEENELDAAFETAFASSVTLSGGGVLRIDRTRALTAVDVDTTGRDRNKSGLSVNEAAVVDLANQIRLRRLSGLIVLDLAGAPKGQKAQNLRDLMLGELQTADIRGAKVLAPSALGLMELSLKRTVRPLLEFDPMQCGPQRRKLEIFAEFLRAFERAAVNHRTSTCKATISMEMKHILDGQTFDWMAELSRKYGSRFDLDIEVSQTNPFEIRAVE